TMDASATSASATRRSRCGTATIWKRRSSSASHSDARGVVRGGCAHRTAPNKLGCAANREEPSAFGPCRSRMSTVFSGIEKRRVVWAWHGAGTEGRCRLLWKLDDVGARIWAESHELDLERVEGTEEDKTVAASGVSLRGRAFQRLPRETPAQVRRFPRR